MKLYHLNNRPNREITDNKEITEILKRGKYAVISMCRNEEPYIVTLSYGYDETSHSLFFHTASNGLKLDFVKSNPIVCATVIEDGGYIMNECGHHYKSVVFWGYMTVLSELSEKIYGMNVLLNHLEEDPGVIEEKLKKADGFYHSQMTVLKLEVRQIHGKAGR